MSDITKWEPQIDRAVNSCGRMLPSEQKDDLRQDCFLVVLENIEAITEIEKQGEDEARSYVYRMVRNKCVQLIYKMKTSAPSHAAESTEPRIDRKKENRFWRENAIEAANDGWKAYAQGCQEGNEMSTELGRLAHFGVSDSDLHEAINKLCLDEQFVIRSLFFDGQSTRQVGREVGHSQFWSRTRKAKALQNLRKQLMKEPN